VLAELRAGGISAETRKKLAVKGFGATAHYDTVISETLSKREFK
jgi:AICAR transformylase/IMP cyclohydrolase PurH